MLWGVLKAFLKKGYTVNYIRQLKDVRMSDVAQVGGKNASLGQMIHACDTMGIAVPHGFATTADAYWYFIDHNNLRDVIREQLSHVALSDVVSVQRAGKAIRERIKQGTIPDDLRNEIIQAYQALSDEYGKQECAVAVRSSATAEDLPHASFAGQQESFLHVFGADMVVRRVVDCMASLFTDRAIAYRIQKGFAHDDIALSVCVQKMINADRAVSGVAFSLDTESGFKDVVMIEASYGLGEAIVKGLVDPDEYMVFKTTFQKDFYPLIKKRIGDKKEQVIYKDDGGTHTVAVEDALQSRACLSNEEIKTLTHAVIAIEDYFSKHNDRWCPMDIEWAKDADDGKVYIVQARPETVHSSKKSLQSIQTFTVKTDQKPLLEGIGIGTAVVHGVVRVVTSLDQAHTVQEGDILVTQMTDPDWVPLMKKAAGIITDRGGRTCHAAIVSRELGVPAIVGTHTATEVLKDGQTITLDCSQAMRGFVYDGAIDFKKHEVTLDSVPNIKTKLLVNIADPHRALQVSQLPTDGVGLARVEFIISNEISVHPMALLHPDRVTDAHMADQINKITAAYEHKPDYFTETLARGVGMIAAAFYPRPVIVRMSDFKSNEYRNLIGGVFFEPKEENPMLGLRGASRYYSSLYEQAFALECAAMKAVITQMGLDNITLMIPFVRTPQEGKKVLDIMAEHGLERSDALKIIMMCELPSNVLCIDAFSEHFDGFSIGSNDLTQTVLGADRDSEFLASLFDERDEAVIQAINQAIKGAHRNKKSIGICGQAPSDYSEFAQHLIDRGIDSISLSPDSIIPFLMRSANKPKG